MRQSFFLFVIMISLFSCSKQEAGKNGAYLTIRIDGEDEDIHWEEIAASWHPGSGVMEITAKGFQLKQCRIKLTGIQGAGTIDITRIDQLYYADGIQFQSETVAGRIEILERSATTLKGRLFASLRDSQANNVLHISGSLGVVE